MDEEISIINEKTRNEKIKNFFISNKKFLISSLAFIIIAILSFYSFQIYKDNNKKLISDKYNSAIIEYENGNKSVIVKDLREIIESKDRTYSPLALYFLIDNNLIKKQNDVNQLFDILINKTALENEIRNLIIYKKALYNANFSNESVLLDILNPVINSDSIWKSHCLYLMAEYFYSKNEKKKSKEFYEKILNTKNVNQDIVLEAQKRLNRDLSE